MSDQRYLVTARKYRPKLFRELVAQEHVTETLQNALKLDRLAHAYLFSGPRGVGKTTAARILAKAINCTADGKDSVEPCRACTSCQDFETGRSMNIFEIDAASNNKVEDVRELRETVRIPPQGSRKKVYIIDEVHMLSNAAFNALLKTLEEPPPHVLFIFATTEPHKVLPTILSRCQRFDFRRIPVADIVAHLRSICADEEVTADEESLLLLARKGDGSLRDSLSAFDQAVALCGATLQYRSLADALRVVDIDLYFKATSHVTSRSRTGMLLLVEQVVRSGHDLQEFLVGLAEHLRNLIVARTMEEADLIEAGDGTRERYKEESKAFSDTLLLRLLMIADEAQTAISISSLPRLKLELALLKMAGVGDAVDLTQALEQLNRLEDMAKAGKLAPGLFDAPKPAPEEPGRPAPPKSPEPAGVAEASTDQEPTTKPPKKKRKSSRSPKAQPAPGVMDLFGPPSLESPTDGPAQGPETEAVASVATASVALLTLWPRFVAKVKNEKIHVGALLQHGVLLEEAGDALLIAVPDAFHQNMLQTQQRFLLQHLRKLHVEDIVKLHFTIRPDLSASAHSAPDVDPQKYFEKQRKENPVVRAIIEQFGGEPVW